MNKIEKILEKIHNEMDGLMDAQGNFEYAEHEGAYHALCNLEAYIDSLSKQPTSVSLDEELKRYLSEYYNYNYPKQYIEGTGSSCMPHLIEVAKHFANWQKERTINKACEFVTSNIWEYLTVIHCGGVEGIKTDTDGFEKDFRKSMED